MVSANPERISLRPDSTTPLRPEQFNGGGLHPSQPQAVIPNIFAPTDIPGEENAFASIVMAMGERGKGKTLLMTDMGKMMLERFEQEAAFSRGAALKLLRRRKALIPRPDGGHGSVLVVGVAEEKDLMNACYGAGWTKEQLESGYDHLPADIRVKRRLRRVLANYHVEYADFCHPNLLQLLIEFPQWAWYSYILFDELDTAASTLQSTARHFKGLVDWTHQIRKFHAEMMFTTQFPQEIAHRMLRQVNLFIRPFLMPWKQDLIIDVYDYWGHWTGDQRPKPWPIMPWDAPDEQWMLFNANQGFKWYNTNEYIPSMWSASRDVLIEQQWKKEINQAVAQQEAQASGQAPPHPEKEPLDSRLQNGSVPITSIMDQLKAQDPSIKSTKDAAQKLREAGYEVFNKGLSYYVGGKK
jgi:hypothetical protein